MRGLRMMIAAASAAVPLVTAGCALDAAVDVHLEGTSPVTITETVKPAQAPQRTHGTTRRDGGRIGIACAVTIVYDVREATGSAVLAQTYVLHARTGRLRRGTSYAFDCNGPLVVELPADGSKVRATSTDEAGAETSLPVQTSVGSIPLAFGRHLRPEPHMQLALVSWPQTLAAGEYRIDLAFELPSTRAIREKVLPTAAVSCGRATYLQPIVPAVTQMSRVPALTIDPSASGGAVVLPRIAGAVGSEAEAHRPLSCRR